MRGNSAAQRIGGSAMSASMSVGTAKRGTRLPWGDILLAAIATVSWALIGMAGTAALGLHLLEADTASSLGPMTAAVVALGAGGSVTPSGDVSAFGLTGAEAATAIEFTPLGVSLVGGLLLSWFFLRSLPAGVAIAPSELLARAGAVVAMSVAALGGPAWAGHDVITIDGSSLGLDDLPGAGGGGGIEIPGVGDIGDIGGLLPDQIGGLIDAKAAVGFTVDTAPTLLGGLGWSAGILLIALLASRRTPLPRGWEVLHRVVRPAASALVTVGLVAVAAGFAAAAYAAIGDDHPKRIAGAALLGAPNGVWLGVPIGLFVPWDGRATGELTRLVPTPLDNLLGNGSNQSITLGRLAELDGRVWLLGVATALMMLLAGALVAVRTPVGRFEPDTGSAGAGGSGSAPGAGTAGAWGPGSGRDPEQAGTGGPGLRRDTGTTGGGGSGSAPKTTPACSDSSGFAADTRPARSESFAGAGSGGVRGPGTLGFAGRCALRLGVATALALPLLAWLTEVSVDASLSVLGFDAFGAGMDLHGQLGMALLLGALWGGVAGALGALLARATGAAGQRAAPLARGAVLGVRSAGAPGAEDEGHGRYGGEAGGSYGGERGRPGGPYAAGAGGPPYAGQAGRAYRAGRAYEGAPVRSHEGGPADPRAAERGGPPLAGGSGAPPYADESRAGSNAYPAEPGGPRTGAARPYSPGSPHRPPNPATNPYLRMPKESPQGPWEPQDARPPGTGPASEAGAACPPGADMYGAPTAARPLGPPPRTPRTPGGPRSEDRPPSTPDDEPPPPPPPPPQPPGRPKRGRE